MFSAIVRGRYTRDRREPITFTSGDQTITIDGLNPALKKFFKYEYFAFLDESKNNYNEILDLKSGKKKIQLFGSNGNLYIPMHSVTNLHYFPALGSSYFKREPQFFRKVNSKRYYDDDSEEEAYPRGRYADDSEDDVYYEEDNDEDYETVDEDEEDDDGERYRYGVDDDDRIMRDIQKDIQEEMMEDMMRSHEKYMEEEMRERMYYSLNDPHGEGGEKEKNLEYEYEDDDEEYTTEEEIEMNEEDIQTKK